MSVSFRSLHSMCVYRFRVFLAVRFDVIWRTITHIQTQTETHNKYKASIAQSKQRPLILFVAVSILMVLARRPSKHWKQAHLHKIHWFFVHSLLLHHRMAFFTSVRHIGKRYCCCTFHSVFPIFVLFLFSTLVLHKYYRLCAECTQFSKWIEATRWHWNKESSFIAIYNATH